MRKYAFKEKGQKQQILQFYTETYISVKVRMMVLLKYFNTIVTKIKLNGLFQVENDL